MTRILTALLLAALSFTASAEVWQARYGVAETFDFKLYNADGTLDVDEADGGTEVSVSCNEGAETTATNDFVDEGTFYSIALTATEMQCERITVVVAATTTEVFFIQTSANASAMTPSYEANVGTITDGAIVAADFASGAITATVIAADAITSSEIADGAIDAGALATDTITAAKIAADAIAASEIAADAIGAAEIANAAIDAATFASAAIDAAAIATDAIGAAEIAADAIAASEIAADAIGASELATGAITTAEFAAGAIDAAAIATDAIGAAEIAANAIAAAEVADGAIDEATFATTAGSFDALGIIDQGTAQAATGTTLQLRSAASFADDEIIGATCLITGGSAGVGQARAITDYVSSTDTATVSTWTTTPTGTITYECFGTSAGGGSVSIATGGITASSFASGAIDAAAIAADAIGASELATDAIGAAEIAADAIGASELATGAITTAEFAAGAIDAAAIATDAIGAAEIATDAIGANELAASAIGASELADGGITSAEFGSGAITATVIATDAIGAAEVAADVSTELLAGLANLAVNVAQVSGDATAADNLETAYDDTAGAVRWDGVADQGTAQAATSTTIQLRSAAAFADDELIGARVFVTGGSAGVGQSRLITDYVSSTDTATVSAWTTTPSGTITYKVYSDTAAAGGSAPTAAEVADAVWDEDMTAHQAQGSAGQVLGDSAADTDSIWSLANTNLNATVSSRASQTSVDTVDDFVDTEIATLTTRVGTPSDLGGGASLAQNVADIEAQTDDIGAAGAGLTAADDAVMTRLGAPAGASVSADVADIRADLPSALVSGRIDASVGAMAADVITDAASAASFETRLQTEANDAIVANLLDRLLLNTYDPASPPGAADSLLEDLLESDAGVTRFSINALEQAPSGGGGVADWSADERTAIRSILGIPASGTTPDDPTTGILDTTRDAVAGVQSDTNDIQTRLPAALVSGRMDSSTGAMAANVMTAAAAAADLTTELQSGLATSSAVSALDTKIGTPAGASVSADVAAVEAQTDDIGVAGAGLTAVDDAVLAAIEQTARADAAILNCTTNTANFAGSTTTVACILTDRDGSAITAASGDLEGRELLILSGAQIYEGRFINDTTWDAANSELRLTLSRALPGALADAVTAIVR